MHGLLHGAHVVNTTLRLSGRVYVHWQWHETLKQFRSRTESHPSCAGIGMYPLGALVNHSCKPSAVQVFRGRTMQFRALEDLASGQEARFTDWTAQ